MAFSMLHFFVFLLTGVIVASEDVSFDQNYNTLTTDPVYFKSSNHGREIRLSLDNPSSAGFESKLSYGSGFFHMRIKVPRTKNTAGIVTTFYLTSGSNAHDELDFEFLGNIEGQPIKLQTNVFANGQGNREQVINLWFDPATDFHDYKILWNHRQIVFYVDDTPIRVYKNNKRVKIAFPSQPMKLQASLWHAEWATGGHPTDWSYAPFRAYYQGFDISGCTPQNTMKECYGPNYWWNKRKYWELDSNQRQAYENVRRNYLHYDYCTDSQRHPIPPPECSLNS